MQSAQSFLRLDPLVVLDPVGLSFPDAVVDGDPQELAIAIHDLAKGSATTGLWESQPGTVRFDPYPFDELCVVVSGFVTLRDDSGPEDTFHPGDVFLVRATFRDLWIMRQPLRKFYVELRAQG